MGVAVHAHPLEQPHKRFFVDHYREFTEAAVIVSVSVIACAVTIRMGGLEQLYGMSRGDTIFTLDAFNTIVLFVSIGIATFGIRRIAAQRNERRRRIAAERYARSLVMRDPLTRLPNRTHFEHQLGMLLGPEAKTGATVLLMDLNGFQMLTDRLGHVGGDACIVQAAARLRQHAGGQGCLARFGDDEFALCLAGADAEAATRLALGIINALKEPVLIDAQMHNMGVTIGIAQTAVERLTVGEMLRRAHVALYRARNTHSKCCFFDVEMDSHIRERAVLEHELKAAIGRNEITPHYQPIVDLGSGQIVALEALARWTHPEKGPISPAVFIPLAEDLGLIDELTERVFEIACRDAATWPGQVSLSFNFSPTQLKYKTLAGRVLAILRKAGLPPERLDAEVTESALVEDIETARQVLEALRAAGVRIVMDDFGTGYSSLRHLREMRFDKLKIDRSFVQNLGAGSDSDVITRAIVGMSKGLGLTVTAEGIETVDQAVAISKIGAQQGQGFLFSRALPIGEVRRLLKVTDRAMAA
jgi:diguanylate cyclase (GGDEF)-like protein